MADMRGWRKRLVYTNERCIGCNKCIRACSCMGACVSTEPDAEGVIRITLDVASECIQKRAVRCIAFYAVRNDTLSGTPRQTGKA